MSRRGDVQGRRQLTDSRLDILQRYHAFTRLLPLPLQRFPEVLRVVHEERLMHRILSVLRTDFDRHDAFAQREATR